VSPSGVALGLPSSLSGGEMAIELDGRLVRRERDGLGTWATLSAIPTESCDARFGCDGSSESMPESDNDGGDTKRADESALIGVGADGRIEESSVTSSGGEESIPDCSVAAAMEPASSVRLFECRLVVGGLGDDDDDEDDDEDDGDRVPPLPPARFFPAAVEWRGARRRPRPFSRSSA